MKKIAGMMIILLLVGNGLAQAKHHEVKIAEKAGVGKYLTDAEGKSLYFYIKDRIDKSACSGDCIARWPIYFRDKVAAGEGLKGEDFATIERADGQKQSTFRGYPLYYWMGDSKPGEINGQGYNGVWFVINPDKFPR